MRRTLIAITALCLFPVLLGAAPASAATAEQKKETCTFGADDAKLEGAKRTAYMTKCMSNANYEAAARKDAMKMKKTGAKPAAKKPAAAPAAAPADADPAAPKQ
ncbi:MAG TPA: hypothetical protein VGM57_08495 [Pseudolabrys sp.]